MRGFLGHRDIQKSIFVDKRSSHFDAQTYSHEVATQWTPLAKRFAKIGVDVAAVVGHTGKDLHPEAKRLATLAFWKHQKEVVEFFEDWPSKADKPDGKLFGGPLENLEPADVEYSPDDSAPWAWNLESEIFARDCSWKELRNVLLERTSDNY